MSAAVLKPALKSFCVGRLHRGQVALGVRPFSALLLSEHFKCRAHEEQNRQAASNAQGGCGVESSRHIPDPLPKVCEQQSENVRAVTDRRKSLIPAPLVLSACG